MTAKFKDIIPGEKMTKEWRIRIIGGGKPMGGATSSKTEKWQRMCLCCIWVEKHYTMQH